MGIASSQTSKIIGLAFATTLIPMTTYLGSLIGLLLIKYIPMEYFSTVQDGLIFILSVYKHWLGQQIILETHSI